MYKPSSMFVAGEIELKLTKPYYAFFSRHPVPLFVHTNQAKLSLYGQPNQH